ncbi:MAG: hypothetical protein H0W02_13570 [Ktedonobacteraceae bacterium]|nr:hypothetical protein [Ktedonobacteraceae bacterium]
MQYYPQPPPWPGYPPMVEAERWRGAITRSYTTPAILTLVLYCVMWLPGVIANIVYLQSAKRTQYITGYAPEGKGCLTAMMIVFVYIPLLILVLAAVGAAVLRHAH